MRKILFIYTDNFTTYDIAWAFLEMGYEMEFFEETFHVYLHLDYQKESELLSSKLEQDDFWFVLSYNFIPEISSVCENKKTPYVSWTYDALTLSLHTKQIMSPYNFTYVFDHDEYELVKMNFHPKHLFYMPLAANISRLGGTVINDSDLSRFQCDVSFVGNLYDTDEFQKLEKYQCLPEPLFEHFYYLFDYYTGKWGTETIYNCMDANTCEIINQYMPEGYKNEYLIPDTWYYPFALLSRRIANRDRLMMIERLSKKYNFALFGPVKKFDFPVDQRGEVAYFKEFAKVAYLSKINIHLTIPRIPSGISQRCFDVMGSGGFLMANYRADMVDLFEPDRDFVMYTNIDELEQKIEYFLHHENERQTIARNGYEKVVQQHTCIHRAKEMIMHLNENGFGS